MPDIEQARLSYAEKCGYDPISIAWRACINGWFDSARDFKDHWDKLQLRELPEVQE